jgi:hypothetical protein
VAKGVGTEAGGVVHHGLIAGTIRTTSRYAHLSRERLFEAVESVPVL